ncbi:MAG: helix-turn-helix domain-containing protein [Alphaproteobacteria bacterium]|nr:helix-turn-helix domain-containing protein [Alphaproteobacteria bacterium]MCB9795375.1 helix-turn-helix domain-containing protein [Alphaproteobacteria bacterium]
MSQEPLRQRLKTLRLAAGLSQAELAAKVNRNQHWASRMERDQHLTFEDVEAWCEACGADLFVDIVDVKTAELLRLVAELSEEDRAHLARVVPHLGGVNVSIKEGWAQLIEAAGQEAEKG